VIGALNKVSAFAFAALAIGGVLAGGSIAAEKAPELSNRAQPACASRNERSILATLSGGSKWSLCWDDDNNVGLTLSRVRYITPDKKSHSVLASASLAQIDVPYDDGKTEHLDLPGFGILTTALKASACPGGKVYKDQRGRPDLCAAITDEGLRYEWSDYDFGTGNHVAQLECLSIHTVTPAEWYSYTTLWKFCDDGEIYARAGASGTLAPRLVADSTNGMPLGKGQSRYAMSHYHNVFWRLDFGLRGKVPQPVSQMDVQDDSHGAARSTELSTPPREFAAKSADSRAWMVTDTTAQNSDGHHPSYEIMLHNTDPYRGVQGHAYTDNDVFVTEQHSCETLAAKNSGVGCSTSVDQYVNGELLDHPIVWLQDGFHHVPRDEDEPIMDEHWLGFELIPYDQTSTNQMAGK